MTVVGLHPEELFDKLLEGELSPAERQRLQQHLDGCEVCRFEYAARLDFHEEAQRLAGPPPALPLRPFQPFASELEDKPRVVPLARRRRRGRLVVALVAAALISASAAVASVSGRAPWHALGTWLSEPAAVRTPSEAADPPKKMRSMPPGAAPAAAVATPVAPVVEPTPSEVVAPEHPHVAVAKRAVAPIKAVGAVEAPSAPAPTPVKDAATVKEPSPAAKLFGEANQARRAGDIGRASGLYHLLQDQYAGSPEAELSRVTLALLQLDNGDAQAALVGFERYLAGSSRGLEAEALVGRARALGRLGRRNQEVSAWQEVQRKYPRSIYGRQATERLAALGLP